MERKASYICYFNSFTYRNCFIPKISPVIVWLDYETNANLSTNYHQFVLLCLIFVGNLSQQNNKNVCILTKIYQLTNIF